MKNNRKIVRSETLETVRERERERELYSNKIGFIKYARKLNIKMDNIRADCMPRQAYSLSFWCAKKYKDLDINIKKCINKKHKEERKDEKTTRGRNYLAN